MERLTVAVRPVATTITQFTGMSGATFLCAYALVSLLTGQRNAWIGDLAQLVPPLVFVWLALLVARRSSGQVRVFWRLNAAHGLLWALGQAVWTYYDVARGGVPIVSPTDPLFFLASLPLAAALYGRPDRDRPQWLFEIVALDIVLIALFAAFAYLYFVVSLVMTGGSEEIYNTNLAQLFNGRNLLLAVWATVVWHTASSLEWRRMLGLYAIGLAGTLAGGILYDIATALNLYFPGSLWDLMWMTPFVVLSMAAAQALDNQLFSPSEPAPPLARLPAVSLIAVALLVLIPTTDEISRRALDASALTESLRTRIALGVMIPFGIVACVREFLSRRALLRAGQQLVIAREQLAQKDKLAAVGQLVSGVAHELNNPLQGVLGYAELLELSNDGGGREELAAIRENANRAAAIVRNLLTFAGRSTPIRRWEQMNAVVQEAVSRRAASLRKAGITVRFAPADGLPRVYIDSARFQQVLLNLLENAEEAIAARQSGRLPGGAVPSAQAGEIVVTTGRRAHPDRIVIEIADNGSGVRTADLNRMFDPFFTTRDVGEGAGLGLSVCYGIVREHGGLITGRNRATGGAVFTIELPVSAEGLREELTLPEPRQADERRRALVVDDEHSNATLVRRALDKAGYEVECTTLARRALVMIERSEYDVVVTDVKMPELNGQELYARACQIRPEMSQRFLFITGDIDGEDTLGFLERSQCPYFMKPFNLDRLTSAVDLLVKGHRDATVSDNITFRDA